MTFLLDESYSGWFCIVKDSSATYNPVRVGNANVYDFTGKTVLKVKDTSVFENYHSIDAKYPSGIVISSASETNIEGDIRILQPLFVTDAREFYFYIGPSHKIPIATQGAKEDVKRRRKK